MNTSTLETQFISSTVFTSHMPSYLARMINYAMRLGLSWMWSSANVFCQWDNCFKISQIHDRAVIL